MKQLKSNIAQAQIDVFVNRENKIKLKINISLIIWKLLTQTHLVLNLANGYLHYYRNAMKRQNIFYKMPTTICTQICRYHRIHHDCNWAFGKRMPVHRPTVFVCDDCTATPINHSKILTQHFHRWHLDRLVPVPPCDSIYLKCYRTMCPSVYWTVSMLVWNAFFDAPPMKWPLSIGPVSKMVLSILWMILSTKLKKTQFSVNENGNLSTPYHLLTFSIFFIRTIVRITVVGWACIRINPMTGQLKIKNRKMWNN